jgi:ribosome recycling factor
LHSKIKEEGDKMENVDDIMLELEDKMEKSLAVFHDQLSGIRTGKASPEFVENVQVTYYGTPTRLRELANISTPEPRLIVINAFDPTALGDIEKAILAANLGVTPINDGRLIRVPIPELDEERRKDLVKVLKRIAEEARVAVRNVRREANDHIKRIQKDGKISEDDRDGAIGEVQKHTDTNIASIDEAQAAKEKDLMMV